MGRVFGKISISCKSTLNDLETDRADGRTTVVFLMMNSVSIAVRCVGRCKLFVLLQLGLVPT